MSHTARITPLAFIISVTLLTWVSPVASVSAGQIEGVEFAPTYQSGGQPLALKNMALMRYRLVFKALVAGLYLPSEVPSRRVLDDVPKRLEIHYFWSIRAADIVRASDGLLARNVAPDTLAALRPRIDRLHSFYRDVRAGDRYSLTYKPGIGTQLSLNGVSRGVVPGADFAAAYFSIWFGEESMDESFKQQLLLRP